MAYSKPNAKSNFSDICLGRQAIVLLKTGKSVSGVLYNIDDSGIILKCSSNSITSNGWKFIPECAYEYIEVPEKS